MNFHLAVDIFIHQLELSETGFRDFSFNFNRTIGCIYYTAPETVAPLAEVEATLPWLLEANKEGLARD